jgi:hypothetical protein
MKRVQWRKPNFHAFIGLMICGTVSTLFCILLFVVRCRNRRRSNNVYRHIILRNTLSLSRTPPTVSAEDVLVAPPPPYIPSIASEEEANNPITPPPGYTSLIANAEEQNIPLTPPPEYVP